MNPITEDDIANYLANTPDFFERHAAAAGRGAADQPARQPRRQPAGAAGRDAAREDQGAGAPPDGHGAPRQRERDHRRPAAPLGAQPVPGAVRAARCRPPSPRRSATSSWCRRSRSRSGTWTAAYGARRSPTGVSEDAKTFASSLTQPYCGVNSGFEAVNWLDDTAMAMSVALIPLREGSCQRHRRRPSACWCWPRPIPQRFQSGMGTDFLERIAELASAALSRLARDNGEQDSLERRRAAPRRECPRGGSAAAPAASVADATQAYLEHVRVEKRLAAAHGRALLRWTCRNCRRTRPRPAWNSRGCRTPTCAAGWRRCTAPGAAAAASR